MSEAWQQKVVKAREAGYSWDDINGYAAKKRKEAEDAGYNTKEIDGYFGYNGPGNADKRIADTVKTNMEAANPPNETGEKRPVKNLWEAFGHGLQGSSTGLPIRNELPDTSIPADPGFAMHVADMAGEFIGDIPAGVVGLVAGGAVGTAVEPGGGTVLGAGAGTFALPTAIKETYKDLILSGETLGARDFAGRVAGVAWKTTKAAITGAVTFATGGAVEAAMAPVALGAITKGAIRAGAEVVTATTVGKGLEGQLPEPMDFVDGAILVAGAKVAGHAAELPTKVVTDMKAKLGQRWVDTGQKPVFSAADAEHDPMLRVDLQSPVQPKVEADMSVTKTDSEPLIIPKIKEFATNETGTLKLPEQKVIEPPSDPDVATVLSRIGNSSEPKPTFAEWGQQLYKEMIDDKAPLNRLIKAATEGKAIEDANNPEFLQSLTDGSPGLAHYAITKNMVDFAGEKIGPSLREIDNKFKGQDSNNFWGYVIAKRALEQEAKNKETGFDKIAAQKVVDKFSKNKDFQEGDRQLQDLQNQASRWLVDGDLMSEKGYNQMVAANKAFVPFHRVGDVGEIKSSKTAGKGKKAFNPIKAFTGSTEKIIDPRISIMKNMFLLRAVADRNQANRATVDSLKESGLAEFVHSPPKPIKVTDKELASLGDEAGVDLSDVDFSIFRPNSHALKPDEIMVYRKGKPEVWKVDREVADIVKGLDQQSRGVWDKLVSFPTKVQRLAITLAPTFPLRQIFMDLPWRFITEEKGRNTVADYITGLREVTGNGPLYDQFLRSKAAHATIYTASKKYAESGLLENMQRTDFWGGAWNFVKTPVDALHAWGNMLEDAKRVGEYANRIKAGESKEKAAYEAQGSYLNFNRAGTVSRRLNALIPFFAAHLNGMEKSVSALVKRPWQTSMRAAAVITLPILTAWALNKDKEWYKEAPDWKKDLAVPFHFGPDDGGTTLWLPLPPVFNFIYGALPRRTMEAFVNENPHAWHDVQNSLLGAVAPPTLLATAMLPVMEHVANYSFFQGRPLVSDQLQKSVLAPERFTAYTSETAKGLSRFVNDLPLLRDMELSPIVIENYVSGWSAGMGQLALKASDTALIKSGLIEDPVKPEMGLSDLPFAQSFFTRYPAASSNSVDIFYNRLNKMEQAKGSLDKALQGLDLGRYEELMNKHPEALAKLGNSKEALANQRQFADDITNNKALTPKDKRQLLDMTYGMMVVEAQMANELMDAIDEK